MAMPERAPRRRLQIMDDETRDGRRPVVRRHDTAPAPAAGWSGALIARLTGLIRDIRHKD